MFIADDFILQSDHFQLPFSGTIS